MHYVLKHKILHVLPYPKSNRAEKGLMRGRQRSNSTSLRAIFISTKTMAGACAGR